ncbi:MAG: hypothetical protein U0744_05300 [Gemmataceae bacterium]
MSNFFRSSLALVLFALVGCQSMQHWGDGSETQSVRKAVKTTGEVTAWSGAMALAAPHFIIRNAAERIQGK